MKICSLFAGIGGIDLAFVQAGFEIVWANEIDSDACKTYRYNFPDNNLIEGDIKAINKCIIPDFDVLTAGFPCQPFSVCGKQKGFQDERGNLFFQIVDVIDAKKPKVVFLENVANLVEHDNGRTFNIIHNELASRGYIIRYTVADACDYGVPQHRTRSYIVAFKDEEKCTRFAFPEKIPLEKRIFDIINKEKKADDRLYLKEDTSQYKKMFSAIQDEWQIYRFSDYGIQSSKDGISFTLKANMGTWYSRVPIIKDNFGIRNITPEECLVLMGFPAEYGFPNDVDSKSAYKQIGNSVCVPVVRRIAEQIKEIIKI
ncbi:MAG: DNA (cytosine-5-)-methyltransferase [Clostridiales bacterium]|nr:DNA (cytosine-5-)-methyltransferase [Clostridiales bacterium]